MRSTAPQIVDERVGTAVEERLAEAVASAPEGGSAIDEAVITSLDERLARIEAAEGERLDAGGMTPEIEARIAQLEGSFSDASGSEALDSLRQQLEDLSGAQNSSGAQIAALLSQIEQSSTASTQVDNLVAEVNGRLDEIASGSGEVRTSIASLDERVNAVSGEIRDEIGAVGSSVEELRNGLANVRSEIDGVRASVEGVSGNVDGVAEEVTTAATRIEDISGRVEDLSGRADEIASRVDANASQLTELSSVVEESRSDTTIARALAATNLKTAIDRGSSFAAELENYTAVASDPGEVDQLREFAGRGVPTVAELLDRFPGVANDVVATSIDVAPDAGVMDRLLGSARSVVSVRPVGEQGGDDTGSIVARMEEALKQGDLDRVLGEAESLDEEARQAAEPFLENVRARQTANGLIDSALAQAMRPAG